jgi:8-oxo-dGTP pyrophosphatase MutT (NUDIX family)
MSETPPDLFLHPEGALRPADAVAALLVLPDGRYIMQLRDPTPVIFYPDHWGCFGGAVDEGESPQDAMRRELREELEFELVPTAARQFTRFDFDFAPLGERSKYRIYYEIAVSDAQCRRFELHEGRRVEAFHGRDLLVGQRVVPYDAFAVWMHLSRSTK